MITTFVYGTMGACGYLMFGRSVTDEVGASDSRCALMLSDHELRYPNGIDKSRPFTHPRVQCNPYAHGYVDACRQPNVSFPTRPSLYVFHRLSVLFSDIG